MALKQDNRPGQVYDREDSSVNAGINQLEAFANDPSNATGLAERESNASPEDGQSGARVDNEPPPPSASDLIKAEDRDKSNNWYKPSAVRNKINNKKKALIGAVTAAIATSVIGSFFLLPNLAIRTMTEKTTEFFYSRVEAITEKRLEKYFDGYVRKMILPSLDACGTSITKDCDVIDPGKGRVGQVYRAWSNNRIEQSLLEKHGIVFEKTKGINEINVFKIDVNGNKNALGTYGEKTAVKEVISALDSETQSTTITQRWKLRNVLSKKYNADKWCFIACKKREDINLKFTNAKVRLKAKIALRVIGPVNEKASIYVLCFAIGCSDADIERAGREAVEKYIGQNADELLKEVSDEIGNKKPGKYFTEKLTEKILLKFGVKQGSARAAASAVPIAGQVFLAATLAEAVATIDEKIENKELSKYLRELNEQALVQNFAVWQSMGDDVISGEASAEDTGAAFSIASGYNSSRVWQSINGSDLKDVNCNDGVVLTGESDALVCPEKRLEQTIALEEWRQDPVFGLLIDTTLAHYKCGVSIPGASCVGGPRFAVQLALDGVNYVSGAVSGTAMSAVESAPGVGKLFSFLSGKFAEFAAASLGVISENLFKSIINPDAEGAEIYDQYAASADLTSNVFLGTSAEDGGLEGRALSVAEDAELQTRYFEERREELQEQSVFARYLDIDNNDSLLTTVAIGLPGLFDNGVENFTESPYSTFASIGDVITGKGYAANSLSPASRQAMFGVTQYGYALDDPLLDLDPEELDKPEVCAAYAAAREATAVVDPDTKEKIYTQANPCTTDELIAEVIIKKYNLDSEKGQSTTNDTIDLTEFLADKRQSTENIACDSTGLTSDRVVPGGNDSVLRLCNYSGVEVNSAWSPAVVQMLAAAKADGISITGGGYRDPQRQIQLRKDNCGAGWATVPASACNPPTARPGSSNHEYGLAIDVREITSVCGARSGITTCNASPTYRWLVENASRFGIKKLSSEAWHWSIDGS